MRIIVGIVLFILNFYSFAQNEGKDIIYLKNGKSHRGIIIEQKPGSHIRLLQQPLNDTLTIKMINIDRLTKEYDAGLEKVRVVTLTDSSQYVSKKTQWGVHFSGILGEDVTAFQVGISGFQNLTKKLSVGFGVHYVTDFSEQWGYDLNAIPITIGLRYKLRTSKSGRLSLVFNTEFGYLFNFKQLYGLDGGIVSPTNTVAVGDGIYFHPEIAAKIGLSKESAIMFGVGYHLTSAGRYGIPELNDIVTQLSPLYHSNLSLRLSYIF